MPTSVKFITEEHMVQILMENGTQIMSLKICSSRLKEGWVNNGTTSVEEAELRKSRRRSATCVCVHWTGLLD